MSSIENPIKPECETETDIELQTSEEGQSTLDENNIVSISKDGKITYNAVHPISCFVSQNHFKLCSNELVRRINKDCVIQTGDLALSTQTSTSLKSNVVVTAISAVRNNSLVLRFVFVKLSLRVPKLGMRSTVKNEKFIYTLLGHKDFDVVPEVDTIELSADGKNVQYCALNKAVIKLSSRHAMVGENFIQYFIKTMNETVVTTKNGKNVVTNSNIKIAARNADETFEDDDVEAIALANNNNNTDDQLVNSDLENSLICYDHDFTSYEATAGICTLGTAKNMIYDSDDEETENENNANVDDNNNNNGLNCDLNDLRQKIFDVYEIITSHCKLQTTFIDSNGDQQLANCCFAIDNITNSITHQLKCHPNSITVMIFPSLVCANIDVSSIKVEDLCNKNPSETLNEHSFISFKSYNIKIYNPHHFAFGAIFSRDPKNNNIFVMHELQVYCPEKDLQNNTSLKKLTGYINQCHQQSNSSAIDIEGIHPEAVLVPKCKPRVL